ncbi:MAG: preprotein translocase subunit YajC [Pirellulales bacterium]|nr:preprotein translocase subunit YajC [Pirellulales bacterium]
MTDTFWMDMGLLAQDGNAGGLAQILTLIVPIGILFYFLMIRPQQRERAQRQSMIDAIKKNDRIVTIGGIYGVVLNVRREDDEVTIKIDEANNTKLRITFGAIARVIAEESSGEK